MFTRATQCVRDVLDPPVSAFSLSLYRHPFLYTLFSSRFTLIINNTKCSTVKLRGHRDILQRYSPWIISSSTQEHRPQNESGLRLYCPELFSCPVYEFTGPLSFVVTESHHRCHSLWDLLRINFLFDFLPIWVIIYRSNHSWKKI